MWKYIPSEETVDRLMNLAGFIFVIGCSLLLCALGLAAISLVIFSIGKQFGLI